MFNIEEKNRVEKFKQIMNGFDVDQVSYHLQGMGFFTAPASANHHGNYPGGLFDHSFAVTQQLTLLTSNLCLPWQKQRSPLVVGMLHDLCKCDSYVQVKSGSGYEYNQKDSFPGHGEKSVLIAARLLQLTEEEIYCIRYHMGAYKTDEWEYYKRAIIKYPNVLWTHTSDMSASIVKGI